MASFDIYLEIDKDYIKLINDIYKILVILIVFQLIVSLSNEDKNIISMALTGSIMNDNFMSLLIYLLIGILSYYLIFDRIPKKFEI